MVLEETPLRDFRQILVQKCPSLVKDQCERRRRLVHNSFCTCLFTFTVHVQFFFWRKVQRFGVTLGPTRHIVNSHLLLNNAEQIVESCKKKKRNILCESMFFQSCKPQYYLKIFKRDSVGSFWTLLCPILREYWTSNEAI